MASTDAKHAAIIWSLLRRVGRGDFDAALKANIHTGITWEQMLPHVPGALSDAAGIFPEVRATPIGHVIHTLSATSESRCAQVYNGLAARWFNDGMPLVEVSPQLAASMMMTSVGEDVLNAQRFPFSGFTIGVPRGLVWIDAGAGRHWVDTLYAGMCGSMPGWCARAEVGSLYSVQPTMGELLSGSIVNPHATSPLDLPVESDDERASLLLSRLAAGVILYMTGGMPTKNVGAAHVSWRGDPRGSKNPKTRTFRLTHAVAHDMRPAVDAYMNGTSRKATVQSVVSGHWKSQAHGIGRAQRKTIFVEPYWRGSEDAPIALRQHKLS